MIYTIHNNREDGITAASITITVDPSAKEAPEGAFVMVEDETKSDREVDKIILSLKTAYKYLYGELCEVEVIKK